MRFLAAVPMLAVTLSLQARDMFVVVHTRDAKIEVYVCQEGTNLMAGADALTRTVVRDRGSFNWHVVGGVAPYTVIELDGPVTGAVCVTVIDALGQVASGCGVIQTFVDVRSVPCPQFNDPIGEPSPAAVQQAAQAPKAAPPTPKPVRHTPRIGPSEPQVRGGGNDGGGNVGLVRGYSSRGPAGGGEGGVLGTGQRTRNPGSGTGGSGGTIPRPTTPGVRW